MKLRKFKRLFVSCFGAITLAGVSLSDDEASSGQAYLFIGGDLSAKQGKGHFPIVAVTKKGILVDNGMDLKKVAKNSPVLLQLRATVTDTLVKVEDFDVAFSSSLPSRIEATALSDMTRHQFGIEQEIANLENVHAGRGRYRQDYERIEELQREDDEFQSSLRDHLDEASHNAEKLADTAHLKFNLLPDDDYEDAYVAVAISFFGRNSKSGNRGEKKFSQVYVSYLGDLRKSRVEEVSLRLNLKFIVREVAECELFLYCENGKQIATNLSRGIQTISEARAQEIRERLGYAETAQ